MTTKAANQVGPCFQGRSPLLPTRSRSYLKLGRRCARSTCLPGMPRVLRINFFEAVCRCSTPCKAKAVQVQYVLQGQASCTQQAENEQSCTPQALSKVCCAVRRAKLSKLCSLYTVRCICCTCTLYSYDLHSSSTE